MPPFFKLGSRGPIEYAWRVRENLGDTAITFDPENLGHEDLLDELEISTECFNLCLVNQRWLFTHSKVCNNNTTNTSYDNDFGRFFEAGALYSRKPGTDWTVEPFAIVKSLTEGGFWMIARTVWLDDMGYVASTTEPQARARPLKGIGEIAYARVPDSLVTPFLSRYVEGENSKEDGEGMEYIDSNEEFVVERQYTGGFVLEVAIVV